MQVALILTLTLTLTKVALAGLMLRSLQMATRLRHT